MDVYQYLSFVVVFFSLAFFNALLAHMYQAIARIKKIKPETANQSTVIKHASTYYYTDYYTDIPNSTMATLTPSYSTVCPY